MFFENENFEVTENGYRLTAYGWKKEVKLEIIFNSPSLVNKEGNFIISFSKEMCKYNPLFDDWFKDLCNVVDEATSFLKLTDHFSGPNGYTMRKIESWIFNNKLLAQKELKEILSKIDSAIISFILKNLKFTYLTTEESDTSIGITYRIKSLPTVDFDFKLYDNYGDSRYALYATCCDVDHPFVIDMNRLPELPKLIYKAIDPLAKEYELSESSTNGVLILDHESAFKLGIGDLHDFELWTQTFIDKVNEKLKEI